MDLFRQKIIILLIAFFYSAVPNAQDRQYFSEMPLFINGQDGYACYRIPAIIQAPNGDVLAFAEGRVNGCSDFGNVDIVMKRSPDNGLSWSDLYLIVDNGKLQAGNPAAVVDELDPQFKDGRIFLFYNTGTASEHDNRLGKGVREVWYITSTDNGANWSSPENITASVHRINRPEYNSAYSNKEDWRSYANTPGHAIQLKKPPFRGRLFVPANHSEGEPKQGFNEYRAHAFFSDDHGKTWQLSESVDIPSSNESIAVELSDGRVMQNIRHQNGESKNRIVAISSDGGATWDTTYFDAQLPSPVCQASIINYTTPNADRVLLFSNPANQQTRTGMRVKVSYDDGKTWLLSRLIREGASAYSDLVIQSDNLIGLLYEHGNDGGIHYAHFNYGWLIGAKNNTDNAWVKKLTNPALANNFQFQLADPILESDAIFFEKENQIRLKLDYEDSRIHYTLDGTEPGEHSPLYREPIRLTQTATLKARAFHSHCLPSTIVEQPFFKVGQPKAIVEIGLENAPSPQYPGGGATALMDLKKGSLNFREPAWLGFSGDDIELVVEFESVQSFEKITASTLSDPASWIFLPEAMEVWIAENGKDYQRIGQRKFDPPHEDMATGMQFLSLDIEKQKARYVKVILKNIPEIPEWHPGKGTPAWLFIDEVLIE